MSTKKKKPTLDEVLKQRKQQHGDFRDHSKISQELKRVVRSGVSFSQLNDIELEGLEMILHKIARIVSGDPHKKDHWVDQAGYSTLVANTLED